jgi:hypothetical protein
MSDYQCPKCLSTDYFLGKRNVSGTFFNILRTKQVPICKVCDEIMLSTLVLNVPKLKLSKPLRVAMVVVCLGILFVFDVF